MLDAKLICVSAASEMGRRGGRARAAKLTSEQRSAIASIGGKARYAKKPTAEGWSKIKAVAPITPGLEMRRWFELPSASGDVTEYIRRAWTKRSLALTSGCLPRDGGRQLRCSITRPARHHDGNVGLVPQTRDALALGSMQGTIAICYRFRVDSRPAALRDTPDGSPREGH
jgi:hypothetical protein